jgi:hypothetical protein
MDQPLAIQSSVQDKKTVGHANDYDIIYIINNNIYYYLIIINYYYDYYNTG